MCVSRENSHPTQDLNSCPLYKHRTAQRASAECGSYGEGFYLTADLSPSMYVGSSPLAPLLWEAPGFWGTLTSRLGVHCRATVRGRVSWGAPRGQPGAARPLLTLGAQSGAA